MKTAGSVQDILLETFPAAPVHFINNLSSSYIEGQLRHIFMIGSFCLESVNKRQQNIFFFD